MKNPKALLMIVIAIAIGLGAVFVASRWISQQATIEFDKVVVAAQDIDLGTRLTPQMLRVADWPKGSAPAGASENPSNLDTRVLKISLQRGEPVLESKLAPVGSTGGLSAVISEGNRAITVRVNDVIGVAGFALPGNYVDIVVNTEDDSKVERGVSKSVSKIVLEHILVLAVAQEQSRDETKPKVVNAVTLEVTPEQAEKLDLARSVGTLSLVLRNQVDNTIANTSGVTKSSLLSIEPAPVAPALQTIATETSAPVAKPVARRVVKQPSGIQVEVIRGNTRSVEQFKVDDK